MDAPGGIGRYVREVLAALGRRTDVRVTVLTTEPGCATVRRTAGSVLESLLVAPRSDQVSLALWARYRSGPAFARSGAEIVIGTKHLVPRTSEPTMLVVHDLLTITRAHENALVKRVLLPRHFRPGGNAKRQVCYLHGKAFGALYKLSSRSRTCSISHMGVLVAPQMPTDCPG